MYIGFQGSECLYIGGSVAYMGVKGFLTGEDAFQHVKRVYIVKSALFLICALRRQHRKSARLRPCPVPDDHALPPDDRCDLCCLLRLFLLTHAVFFVYYLFSP